MKKLLMSATALGGAVALALVGGQAAIAAEGDPVTVSHTTVSPGGDFFVSGAGCDVGAQVALGFAGETIQVLVDSDGAWNETLTAPSQEGTYSIEASCETEGSRSFHYADASIDVDAPSVAPPTLGEPTRDGCQVTVPVHGAAGVYAFKIWDDGAAIETHPWQKATNETDFFVWTIVNPAGEAAPGVGIDLTDPATDRSLATIDPYTYPAEVADSCAEIAQGGGATPPTPAPTSPESPTQAAPKPPQAVQAATAGQPASSDLGSGLAVAGVFALAALAVMGSRAVRREMRG